MNQRPARVPTVPLINPSAAEVHELAENFRRIYAGALADHRSIEAGGGVYAVKAVAPLAITDDGVAFNWQDPAVYEVLAGVVLDHPDSGKVKVDDGDAPDFLEGQIVDYAGATDDWVGVHIVKPAAHEALQARVSKSDLQAALGGGGGSLELAIHYKGCDSVLQTLGTDDWRTKYCRVFARAGQTLSEMRTMTGTGGWAASLWPSQPVPVNCYLAALGTQTLNFMVYADAGDGGKLKLAITNPNSATNRGAWNAAVSYNRGDVVSQGGGYYQSAGDGNLGNAPPGDGSWWIGYTMTEGWFHVRIDVIEQVPGDGYAAAGNGNG